MYGFLSSVLLVCDEDGVLDEYFGTQILDPHFALVRWFPRRHVRFRNLRFRSLH